MELFDRLRGDLDFNHLVRTLEIYECQELANQVRDLRDRLVRGVPVTANNLDIEQFLAFDLLLSIRKMFKIPYTEALLVSLQNIADNLELARSEYVPEDLTTRG